jgi:hypothetical protein
MMVSRSTRVCGACCTLVLGVSAAMAAPAAAQAPQAGRFFSEIRVGLQAHDVPLFSSRVESGVQSRGLDLDQVRTRVRC